MDEKLEQVLHKVELLCEQNPEFAAELRKYLGIELIVEPSTESATSTPDTFASAMRLQHKRCGEKARDFYESISDSDLYQDLVKDYANMLWYKSMFNVGKYFVHVNFQIENMLNYYLDHSNFHKKIVANAPQYKYELTISDKYTISIDVLANAFDKNKNFQPIEPAKMNSLWAKLLFWAIDTNQKDLLEKKKKYFNAIISVRNEANHANYASEKKSLNYWQQQDSLQFGYIEDLIKKLRDSVVALEQ